MHIQAAGCVPATFSNITLFGADILSTSAELVTNYNGSCPYLYRPTQPSASLDNATFCNVTVTYTHPGQNDTLIVEAWLPSADEWNSRLQAVGGGGWNAGRYEPSYTAMVGAIADGYATITTDAGLGNSSDPTDWALLSNGNVNLYNLQNLGSVSLNDMAILGKSIIRNFYGKGPEYSYWNGCSQGGRQGLMLAQRYPTAFDGIAIGSPAIYWTELFPTFQWPQQVMNMGGEFPRECEIDALTSKAIDFCDELDGVKDGIIGAAYDCQDKFDPFKYVGEKIQCGNETGTIKISEAAAVVTNGTWKGMQTADGKPYWFGLLPGVDLTGNNPTSYQPGSVTTTCDKSGCKGSPISLGVFWLQLFVAQGHDLDLSNITHAHFDDLAVRGRELYRSLISTDDANLAPFKEAGGKLVVFHGMADNAITPHSTDRYYNEVAQTTGGMDDFFRYFQIPGLAHCVGGSANPPTSLFGQLRSWVEKGNAPNTTDYSIKDLDGNTQNRTACLYPKQEKFDKDCGDSASAKCWSCVYH